MANSLYQHPVIDSLPQHSYPLSILFDPVQYEPLIMDRFINLKADNYHNEVAILDYCEDSFLTFPMFINESRSCCRTDITTEISEYVISRLDNGYCVFLHVDEYYLSFAGAYKKYSFGHGIMVNGYNKEEDVFFVTGYNQNNKLSNNVVSFFDLAQAYNNMGPVLERNKVEYLSRIFLIKNDNTRPAADISLFIKSLSDFTKSVNTVKNYPRDYDTNCETLFGLKIYDLLIDHFKTAHKKDIPLLPKNSYLLLEHKKIMSLRLSLLADQTGINLIAVQEQYSSIENKCNLLLKLHLKLLFTKSKNILTKIANLLEEIKDAETTASNSLLAVLSDTTSR